jgi:hypothetical protein
VKSETGVTSETGATIETKVNIETKVMIENLSDLKAVTPAQAGVQRRSYFQ